MVIISQTAKLRNVPRVQESPVSNSEEDGPPPRFGRFVPIVAAFSITPVCLRLFGTSLWKDRVKLRAE